MIVLAVAILATFLSIFFYLENKEDERRRENIRQVLNAMVYKPFSPSEYLGRIEQEHVKILQDKAEKEEYVITLWLGLEGLRIGKDGTLEWVNRGLTYKWESVFDPGRYTEVLTPQYITMPTDIRVPLNPDYPLYNKYMAHNIALAKFYIAQKGNRL